MMFHRTRIKDKAPEDSIEATQPRNGEAVTAILINCCANCVDTSRPINGGPIYVFGGQVDNADQLSVWHCSS